jgi:hypothetical protein
MDSIAKRYTTAAHLSTTENPKPRAMMTLNTELTTDRQPLTAQDQGTSFVSVPSAKRMPMGKGIPIRNPKGASSGAETA